jgi:hypothetical protein
MPTLQVTYTANNIAGLGFNDEFGQPQLLPDLYEDSGFNFTFKVIPSTDPENPEPAVANTTITLSVVTGGFDSSDLSLVTLVSNTSGDTARAFGEYSGVFDRKRWFWVYDEISPAANLYSNLQRVPDIRSKINLVVDSYREEEAIPLSNVSEGANAQILSVSSVSSNGVNLNTGPGTLEAQPTPTVATVSSYLGSVALQIANTGLFPQIPPAADLPIVFGLTPDKRRFCELQYTISGSFIDSTSFSLTVPSYVYNNWDVNRRQITALKTSTRLGPIANATITQVVQPDDTQQIENVIADVTDASDSVRDPQSSVRVSTLLDSLDTEIELIANTILNVITVSSIFSTTFVGTTPTLLKIISPVSVNTSVIISTNTEVANT